MADDRPKSSQPQEMSRTEEWAAEAGKRDRSGLDAGGTLGPGRSAD